MDHIQALKRKCEEGNATYKDFTSCHSKLSKLGIDGDITPEKFFECAGHLGPLQTKHNIIAEKSDVESRGESDFDYESASCNVFEEEKETKVMEKVTKLLPKLHKMAIQRGGTCEIAYDGFEFPFPDLRPFQRYGEHPIFVIVDLSLDLIHSTSFDDAKMFMGYTRLFEGYKATLASNYDLDIEKGFDEHDNISCCYFTLTFTPK